MSRPQPHRSTLHDFVYPVPLKVQPAVAFTYLWPVANIGFRFRAGGKRDLSCQSVPWKSRSGTLSRSLEESEIDVSPVETLTTLLAKILAYFILDTYFLEYSAKSVTVIISEKG